MNDLTSAQKIRFQKLWDVFLLTQFFMNKNGRTYSSCKKFRAKHDLTVEQFATLKRTPYVMRKTKAYSYLWCFDLDFYCFVAQKLKPLYKFIESKSVEDVFDIAQELQQSSIDTVDPVCFKKEDSRMRSQLAKTGDLLFAVRDGYVKNFGRGCIGNAAFFKG